MALHFEGVVGAWVIHVVGCTRKYGQENVHGCHLAELCDIAAVDYVVQMIHDIRGMALVVILDRSVRHLRMMRQVLQLDHIELRNIGLPVASVADVHQGEV